MSATMTEDVETLKGLTLRNPVRAIITPVMTISYHGQFKVILRLEEREDEAAHLSQYSVRSALIHILRISLSQSPIGRQVLGSGQIPARIRNPQAQAHQRQMHIIRERCGS